MRWRLAGGANILYLTDDPVAKFPSLRQTLAGAHLPDGPLLPWQAEEWWQTGGWWRMQDWRQWGWWNRMTIVSPLEGLRQVFPASRDGHRRHPPGRAGVPAGGNAVPADRRARGLQRADRPADNLGGTCRKGPGAVGPREVEMIGRAIGLGFATARDRLAVGLVRVGVRPNTLTLAGLVLTTAAGVCYALGASRRFAWSLHPADAANAYLLLAGALMVLSIGLRHARRRRRPPRPQEHRAGGLSGQHARPVRRLRGLRRPGGALRRPRRRPT